MSLSLGARKALNTFSEVLQNIECNMDARRLRSDSIHIAFPYHKCYTRIWETLANQLEEK